jgi:hypothetical protein
MICGAELRVHFLKSFQKGSTCENLSQKGLKSKKVGKGAGPRILHHVGPLLFSSENARCSGPEPIWRDGVSLSSTHFWTNIFVKNVDFVNYFCQHFAKCCNIFQKCWTFFTPSASRGRRRTGRPASSHAGEHRSRAESRRALRPEPRTTRGSALASSHRVRAWLWRRILLATGGDRGRRRWVAGPAAVGHWRHERPPRAAQWAAARARDREEARSTKQGEGELGLERSKGHKQLHESQTVEEDIYRICLFLRLWGFS